MSSPTSRRAEGRVLGRLVAGIAILALALPVVVVTGNLRRIPVLGGLFGPPRLITSAPVDVGLDVSRVVAGDGAVWLLRASDHRVLRVGAGDSGIRVPDATRDLVAGGGRLWLLVGGDVIPADPGTGKLGEPLDLQAPDGDFSSFNPATMAWGAGGLWVLDGTKLLRVGSEGTVTQRVVLPLDQISPQLRLLVGEDSVWVVADRRYDVVVVRIDTDSGKAEQAVTLPGMSLQPFDTGAVGRGAVWFAARDKKTGDGFLVAVDTRSGRAEKKRESDSPLCPGAVRAGGGRLWQRCSLALELLSASLRVEGKADTEGKDLSLADWTVDAHGDAWFVMRDGADHSLLQRVSRPR